MFDVSIYAIGSYGELSVCRRLLKFWGDLLNFVLLKQSL